MQSTRIAASSFRTKVKTMIASDTSAVSLLSGATSNLKATM